MLCDPRLRKEHDENLKSQKKGNSNATRPVTLELVPLSTLTDRLREFYIDVNIDSKGKDKKVKLILQLIDRRLTSLSDYFKSINGVRIVISDSDTTALNVFSTGDSDDNLEGKIERLRNYYIGQKIYEAMKQTNVHFDYALFPDADFLSQADELIRFIMRCEALIGQKGIREIRLETMTVKKLGTTLEFIESLPDQTEVGLVIIIGKKSDTLYDFENNTVYVPRIAVRRNEDALEAVKNGISAVGLYKRAKAEAFEINLRKLKMNENSDHQAVIYELNKKRADILRLKRLIESLPFDVRLSDEIVLEDVYACLHNVKEKLKDKPFLQASLNEREVIGLYFELDHVALNNKQVPYDDLFEEIEYGTADNTEDDEFVAPVSPLPVESKNSSLKSKVKLIAMAIALSAAAVTAGVKLSNTSRQQGATHGGSAYAHPPEVKDASVRLESSSNIEVETPGIQETPEEPQTVEAEFSVGEDDFAIIGFEFNGQDKHTKDVYFKRKSDKKKFKIPLVRLKAALESKAKVITLQKRIN